MSETMKFREYRLKRRDDGLVFGFNALMSQEPNMILFEEEIEIPKAHLSRYQETRAQQDKELAEMAAANEPPVSDQATLIKAIEDRIRAELERKFATVQFQPEPPREQLPEPPSLEPELHGPPAPPHLRKRRNAGLNTDLGE